MIAFCTCYWFNPHDANGNNVDTFKFVMTTLVVVINGWVVWVISPINGIPIVY